jgi:hypothetical protein
MDAITTHLGCFKAFVLQPFFKEFSNAVSSSSNQTTIPYTTI